MATFKNLTPHTIKLNDGREFAPSGEVARVSSKKSSYNTDGIADTVWGEVVGLPPVEDGVYIIVSGLVASRTDRKDVVSPDTGSKECVRDTTNPGIIISVPGFVRNVK